jgi:hypothetical protein
VSRSADRIRHLGALCCSIQVGSRNSVRRGEKIANLMAPHAAGT